MSYNGWTNYETWCVNLWLTNDEGTYRDIAHLSRVTASNYALAQTLKGYVEDLIDEIAHPEGFVADLINSALSEVDWDELAEHYRADFVGDVANEEEGDAEEDDTAE